MDFSWMGWTVPTAIFFCTIGGLILMMFIWEMFSPGGNARIGILGLNTTRGDRLFMSLLLSAIVALAWLALPIALWWVLLVCLALSVLIFRFC
jgi:predicted small integral membrane protein